MLLKEDIIKNNYEKIKNDVEKYSIYPEKVKILFVTKYFDIEEQKQLIDMGYNYFGENKAQLYRDKLNAINEKNIKWDFIGHLQKNKIKYIIGSVNLIHSVDSLELLETLNTKLNEMNKKVDVLIQINVSKEESKYGLYIEDFEANADKYFSYDNVNIKGFMTMAPLEVTETDIKSYFDKLYLLKEKYKIKYKELEELSMGMSGDYKEALRAGATIIRIGSLLFQ